MTFEEYPTKAEAEQQAKEYATPLNKLIRPSDVQDDAESWNGIDSGLLDMECWEAAGVIATEHREIRNLIQERAFRIWTDGFKRVSESALAEDVPLVELIHVYNVWPNHVNKWDAYEEAHRVFESPNYRIPNDCYNQARGEVISGLMEGTKPDL